MSGHAACLHAIVARALEIWVIGDDYMAAHVADKPGCPLQHRPELIAQNAVGTANYLPTHFEPSDFWRSLLIRASVTARLRSHVVRNCSRNRLNFIGRAV